MKTWKMMKELTKNEKKFFKTTYDEDEFIICFIRPYAGTFEFRLFDVWDGYKTNNVMLYPEENWKEITKEEADIWLKGHYDLLI